MNSRRDGSPFVNLLMIAPLCDSRGQIRYHIGAQVDVSGLVKDCTDLESFQQLVMDQNNRQDTSVNGLEDAQKKDEFQEVCLSSTLHNSVKFVRLRLTLHLTLRHTQPPCANLINTNMSYS